MRNAARRLQFMATRRPLFYRAFDKLLPTDNISALQAQARFAPTISWPVGIAYIVTFKIHPFYVASQLIKTTSPTTGQMSIQRTPRTFVAVVALVTIFASVIVTGRVISLSPSRHYCDSMLAFQLDKNCKVFFYYF